MDFAASMLGDDPVREVEELDPAPPFIVPSRNLPLATSKAANNVVVPCRLYWWLWPVNARPLASLK